MFEAKIYVTHKPSILDPQGEAIKGALHRLNFKAVDSITQGKYFVVKIKAADQDAAVKVVKDICKHLLVNPNMETYRYEIKDV